MPKKLRVVNSEGKTMHYQGKLLVFDLDNPEVTIQSHGFDERERAEMVLSLVQHACENGPFKLEEFEG